MCKNTRNTSSINESRTWEKAFEDNAGSYLFLSINYINSFLAMLNICSR